ncbi:MAG: MarR family transcriptional regulator, partial [Bacteroidota bacterium]
MKDSERLENIIYFIIDRTLRKSRQYSVQQLHAHGFDVTLDQWVVIRTVFENPGISQKEVADLTYKDAATLTRILDLIGKKGYVERRPNPNDRRKFELHLTTAGNELVEQVMPLIFGIRSRGVQGI